ncbi:MAG: PEP-CTERM sorting domain-containing protein [Pirellulales bacterium]|nr:PEP-CTERM sorting domain-containing protein [Pirellulales bacterium]
MRLPMHVLTTTAWRKGALTLMLLTFAASTADAAPTVFFNGFDNSKAALTNSNAARDSLVATLSSYGVETLDDPALNGVVDPPLAFPGTGITGTSDFDFVVTFATFAVSGANALLDKGPDDRGTPFSDVMTFSEPVTAWGSYFVQGGDGNANTLTFRLENTLLGTSKDVMQPIGDHWPFTNVFYFGVTDTDPFNRVTMIESNDNDGILLDNILVGQVRAVPEPSTWVLLGTGLATLALIHRRRCA